MTSLTIYDIPNQQIRTNGTSGNMLKRDANDYKETQSPTSKQGLQRRNSGCKTGKEMIWNEAGPGIIEGNGSYI